MKPNAHHMCQMFDFPAQYCEIEEVPLPRAPVSWVGVAGAFGAILVPWLLIWLALS